MISSLLTHRLHFLTGKGGVGKSTAAVILSLIAENLGKKVLFIGFDPEGFPTIFNAKRPDFTPAPLTPHIDGIVITPHLSLREYVTRQLKLKKLADFILNNKIVHFFLNAAPGIEEIALMGKIFYLDEETVNGKSRWDMLIIDAPSTGHGLYLFKSPKIFMDITKRGPLIKHTKNIYDMLTNPKRTAIHVISLPEELPVQETIELYREIKKLNLPIGKIFINKILTPFAPPSFFTLPNMGSPRINSAIPHSELSKKINDAVLRFMTRYKIQLHYKKMLEKAVSGTKDIPWILNYPYDLTTLKKLAEELQKSWT